jgi:hypothetical protein
VHYRYFGRWRVGCLLMLIAAGFSAAAVVLPWATAGNASVSVANAGDSSVKLGVIFALAAVALGASVLEERSWAGWVGLAMGLPLGIAAYLAYTGAEHVLLAAGAPATAIQTGLGVSFAITAAIASLAGGAAELIARRSGND